MREGVDNAGELQLRPRPRLHHVVLHADLGRVLHVDDDLLLHGFLPVPPVVPTADVLPCLVPGHSLQLEDGGRLVLRHEAGELGGAVLADFPPGQGRLGAARHGPAGEAGSLAGPENQSGARLYGEEGRD